MRLGDLRGAIGSECRTRDDARVLRDLGRDGALYVVAVAGAVLLPSLAGRLACGVLAGIAATSLFVWAHDAAHGALLGDGRTARVLGTAAMLPSLEPFGLWQQGHNRVHHGFTSLVILDWIWRPWSPDEYAGASRLARAGYRVERSLLGCGWHYLRRVWWDGMIAHRPTTERQRREALIGRITVGAWVLGASGLAFALGGLTAVLTAVVLPWLLFTYAIAFITYLHHTHPTRRFYAARDEWNPVAGHVTGSTVVHVARPLRWLFHDIFIHTPHHLDTRIPYHHLAEAWRQLQPAVGGLDVLQYDASPRRIIEIFRRCKLHDYGDHTWSSFPAPRG